MAPSLATGGPAYAKGVGATSAPLASVVTVDPTRSRVYRVGQNWVYIPANAVCDLGSSYGPAEWDKPCARATAPFELSITVSADDQGHPTARFTPDVRFAPAHDRSGWVVLGLKVKGKLETEGYGILYQPTGSSEWIDESATDATLRAWRAPGNVIARRLKHFSGYNVSLGFQEQASVDIGLGGTY